jgi:predicted acetyltransferase
MTALVRPDVRYHVSLVRAAEELHAEGNGSYLMLEDWPVETLRDPEQFARYVDERNDSLVVPPEKASWWVPVTLLWIVDEADRVVGRVSIRHRLTEHLLQVGGHIGYAVIPSARRRGHATAALAQSLPIAAELGIDPALVTCDDTNVASRRVIEKNGGVLEDVRAGKMRFWVPTHVADRAPAAPERLLGG